MCGLFLVDRGSCYTLRTRSTPSAVAELLLHVVIYVHETYVYSWLVPVVCLNPPPPQKTTYTAWSHHLHADVDRSWKNCGRNTELSRTNTRSDDPYILHIIHYLSYRTSSCSNLHLSRVEATLDHVQN